MTGEPIFIEGEDTNAITEKSNELAQSSMKLGEAMYKATQEEEAAASGGEENAPKGSDANGDVVDADFEEVGEQDESKDEDQDKKTGT